MNILTFACASMLLNCISMVEGNINNGDENLTKITDSKGGINSDAPMSRDTCPWFPILCRIHCRKRGFTRGNCVDLQCHCENDSTGPAPPGSSSSGTAQPGAPAPAPAPAPQPAASAPVAPPIADSIPVSPVSATSLNKPLT